MWLWLKPWKWVFVHLTSIPHDCLQLWYTCFIIFYLWYTYAKEQYISQNQRYATDTSYQMSRQMAIWTAQEHASIDAFATDLSYKRIPKIRFKETHVFYYRTLQVRQMWFIMIWFTHQCASVSNLNVNI